MPRKEIYQKYKEASVAYSRKWRAEHSEQHSSYSKAWRESHKDEYNRYFREWYRLNPEHQSHYRAIKRNASPKWLTKEQKAEIKRIYRERPEGYHVDHIIPINGKEVVGLHVPWNLQYLEAKENIRKSNKV